MGRDVKVKIQDKESNLLWFLPLPSRVRSAVYHWQEGSSESIEGTGIPAEPTQNINKIGHSKQH